MSAPKTPRKPKPSRDPSSGQFDEASPLTDPNLLAFALRTLRAIQDLEPLLADGARHAGEGAKMYAVAGLTLSLIKDSVLRELQADPEAYKEAKKKRLDAVALGNVPLQEQNRVMAMAKSWLALSDGPALTATGGDPALTK